MPTPEATARTQIDRQFKAAGWRIAPANARLHLTPNTPLALCEESGDTGRADYVLYLDGKACGIVEAKKGGFSLVGVAEQSATYAAFRKWDDPDTCWQSPLPFRFEANGDEIRFTDARDPSPRARSIFNFPRPDHLRTLLSHAESEDDSFRRRLAALPGTHPLNESNLRRCQIEALQGSDEFIGLEQSLAENRPRALIQMATGAGKTFMAVTQVYRLIKHAGARRVLFLVDRTNLGRQALKEFREFVPPDDNRKFSDLYTAVTLDGGRYDPVAKVVISTIQGLYAQLRGREEDPTELEDEARGALAHDEPEEHRPPLEVRYNPQLPPETFDLIIVDECHRSIYNLWRQVLDYFDAFLVGLTATPSRDTLGFFNQNLVSQYTYPQSVIDGVNVDYRPYRIRTEVTETGSEVEAGFQLEIQDPGGKEDLILDDDLRYSERDLDRSVVATDQIRTLLTTFKDKLFTDLFPDRPARAEQLDLDHPWVPKTLVFCKDDRHADRVTDCLREIFGKGNDFCKKITYTATSSAVDSPSNSF